MARLILDTSVVIDAHRLETPIEELWDDADDVAISVVTVSELLMGVELVTARRKRRRREQVEELLTLLPVENFDIDVAHSYAGLLAHTRVAGRQRGAHDLVIAATAVARARTVLTADAAGFDELPGVKMRLHPRRSG